MPGNMSPVPNGQPQAAHLTSASLPSLVSARDKDKELEDMLALLEQERKAHKQAQTAKQQLEAELESLSQALFEEVSYTSAFQLSIDLTYACRPTKWSPRSA